MNHTASDFTVDKRVEELKKTVQDHLREGLKGYVGATNTEEGRQKVVAAVAEVLDSFLNTGILPTYEVRVEQEGGTITLVGVLQNSKPRFISEGGFGLLSEQDVKDITIGVDPAKPGGEYTVRMEGYIDDKGVLIFTSQKVVYPEGGPIVTATRPSRAQNGVNIGDKINKGSSLKG